MTLHSLFAAAQIREDEHRRMLAAVHRERSSRVVLFIRHQWERIRLDARRLQGARRLIRLDTRWHRRFRIK